MVTVGCNADGKYQRKTVGYYKTYNDAYKALMEYHENPYDLALDITMEDLYEKWSAEHFKRIGESTISIHNQAWQKCSSIYHMKVRDVRAVNIKQVIEADMPPSMHLKVKSTLSSMLDYAVACDLISKNYAKIVKLDSNDDETKKHIPYTEEEIEALWNHTDVLYVDFILVCCYTGLRPRELLNIKRADVDTKAWTMTGGMKTKAGKGRVIPIHDRIKPFIQSWYDEGHETLFRNVVYGTIRNRVIAASNIIGLNPDHRPHDGRVTFITRMKESGADEYAIKRIVGHQISDITESVYTHRSIEWLRNEVMKIS
jgi:integrase